VEEDTFTDQTPYGIKTFTNVIATKDPEASRRVVVAAHFDSKFFPSYPQNQVRERPVFPPLPLCVCSPREMLTPETDSSWALRILRCRAR
jgi:hypothetical protein